MLRLGIAGIGVIAGDYIGLIAGGRVQGVELTALCSRNEEHIQAVSERVRAPGRRLHGLR